MNPESHFVAIRATLSRNTVDRLALRANSRLSLSPTWF
jgi:hypothetical protein